MPGQVAASYALMSIDGKFLQMQALLFSFNQ
jgi:hypothetical protein